MANFSLLAKLGLDTKAFQKGLSGAKGSAQGFASKMKGILAAATGVGFVGLAKRAIDTGSRISDLSEQLRINAEALQTLNAVAIKAGVDQGSLERALRNVSLRTQEALDGNVMYSESFERLGLDLQTFTKLPTEKKLEQIAKAYAKAGKSQEAFADISQVLGQRAGPKMLEVLRRINEEGFDKLIEGAKKSGQVMSNDVIQTMDEAADIIGRVTNAITVTTANLLKEFEPALKAITKFVSENSEALAKNARRMVSFVVGFKAAKLIVPVVTGLIKAFTFSTGMATGAVARLTIGIKALAMSIKALMASTVIGLAFVAIGELATHFLKAKDKGEDLEKGMGDLGEEAMEMKSEIDQVSEAMGGLSKKMEEGVSANKRYRISIDDLLKLERGRKKMLKEIEDIEKRATKRRQNQTINEMELNMLKLAAQGEKEKALRLKKYIENTKKAIEVSEKYGISLREAAKLVKGVNDQEAARLKQIKEQEEAQERNEKVLEALNEKRPEKTAKEKGDERGDFARILRGEALKDAANQAGEDFGIRFQKEIAAGGEEMFRKFKDGFKGELLTEEQLQAGLERVIEKDPSNETLEKIATLLEGRLTNT